MAVYKILCCGHVDCYIIWNNWTISAYSYIFCGEKLIKVLIACIHNQNKSGFVGGLDLNYWSYATNILMLSLLLFKEYWYIKHSAFTTFDILFACFVPSLSFCHEKATVALYCYMLDKSAVCTRLQA